MFGSSGRKITLEDSVLQKAKIAAGIIGCSVEEFVAKAIERESEKVMATTSSQNPSAAEVDEIAKQLQGLGYLE